MRVLHDELTQEPFKLSNELRYCAPFRDILPFESLKLLGVLFHDTLLNDELWIVAQELLRLVSDVVDAVHVFELLPLLVQDVAFHLIVNSNLISRSLDSILSCPPRRLAWSSSSSQPGIVRLSHLEAMHGRILLSVFSSAQVRLPRGP